jgi:RNA polymerase sigma factor (sigma-70 family)
MITVDIIKASVRNDVKAQHIIYTTLAPQMLAVCYRYAFNKSDAEDMMQEGFIKVFQQVRLFKFEGNFEGWAKRVVICTAINYLKRYRRLDEQLDNEAIENQFVENTNQGESNLHVKAILNCIQELPLGFKTVFNLFAMEGLSHKEIAELLNIKESTSRSQYTRAKCQLESLLIARGLYEPMQTNRQLKIS